MGEIADLGARALDHGAIGLEQQIDLGGERRDVLREVAADALGLAAADRRQALLQHAQRPEAETHRQRGRAEQRHRQHQEGRGERVFELLDLGLDHVGVGGDLDEIAPLVVSVDLALDHAQRLVAGADDITAA